jgi:dienelactone hydrolase
MPQRATDAPDRSDDPRDAPRDDRLDDFARRTLTFPLAIPTPPRPDDANSPDDATGTNSPDTTKVVYVGGRGPAVVVLSEMPGLSPDVLRFARWVRDAGFTVYLPSLFGRDGAYPHAEPGLRVLRRACISAEFQALAANVTSPVTHWLRALARIAHAECGGPGVGAVGMCFTGNFALTMMLEPAVLAPVLCQPSLPLGDPAALHIAPGDLARVRARLEHDDLSVLAYRMEGDRYCTGQRFAAYAKALGARFDGRVVPASAANPSPPPFFAEVIGCPHSVVTAHLVDRDGEPTREARDAILAFLAQRLHAPSPSAP